MENIDSIKIVQVDGLNGGAGGAGTAGVGGGAGGGNLSDQVVFSALRYRAQAPLVDQLLAEVGLSGGDLNGMTAAFRAVPAVADRQAAPALAADAPVVEPA